jgi:hypothetical protein
MAGGEPEDEEPPAYLLVVAGVLRHGPGLLDLFSLRTDARPLAFFLLVLELRWAYRTYFRCESERDHSGLLTGWTRRIAGSNVATGNKDQVGSMVDLVDRCCYDSVLMRSASQ